MIVRRDARNKTRKTIWSRLGNRLGRLGRYAGVLVAIISEMSAPAPVSGRGKRKLVWRLLVMYLLGVSFGNYFHIL